MDRIRLIELKNSLYNALYAASEVLKLNHNNDLAIKDGRKSDQKLLIEAKRYLDKCLVEIADKYKAL